MERCDLCNLEDEEIEYHHDLIGVEEDGTEVCQTLCNDCWEKTIDIKELEQGIFEIRTKAAR